MNTYVFIQTEFAGFHRWKDAPDSVAFLRSWHRHIFKVKFGVDVKHNNRDVEFFTLKHAVDVYLRANWEGRQFEASCEDIAADLLAAFNAAFVEVSEDGENGAVVSISPLQSILRESHNGGAPDVRAFETAGTVYSPDLSDLLKKKEGCFTGTEAEGPHRGEKVLFVPGSTSPQRFWEAWVKCKGKNFRCSRIYYGAGNDHAMRTDTLNEIADICIRYGRALDVEVESMKDFPPYAGTQIDLTRISLDPADTEEADFIKTVSENHIDWTHKNGDQYTTKLNDPLFTQDRYL